MTISFTDQMPCRTLMLSGGLLLATWLTFAVLDPLTRWIYPETAVNAIVVFLPHCVRVVGAWLYGWLSAAYLLPAQVILFIVNDGMGLPTGPALLLFAVYLVTAPLAFQILAIFGFDLRSNAALRYNWRSVVFAGAIAAGMNAVSLHLIRFDAIPTDEHLSGVAYLVLGDVLGVIVGLATMMGLSRMMRSLGG